MAPIARVQILTTSAVVYGVVSHDALTDAVLTAGSVLSKTSWLLTQTRSIQRASRLCNNMLATHAYFISSSKCRKTVHPPFRGDDTHSGRKFQHYITEVNI